MGRPHLDPELRHLFNYSRNRSLASVAKKPGRKLSFNLSHYIHPSDSPTTVSNVLSRIRDVHFYQDTPIFGYLTRELKKDLRSEYTARAPKCFTVTFEYRIFNPVHKKHYKKSQISESITAPPGDIGKYLTDDYFWRTVGLHYSAEEEGRVTITNRYHSLDLSESLIKSALLVGTGR
ncbi:hypothetical protein OAO87_01165 [bacterium]|nr:hypothetical protein [bacterium]